MRRLAIVLAVVAFAAVACSNEEPTVTEPSAAPTSAAPAAINDHGTKSFTSENFSAELELDNFYFSPTFIKSPGGGTATLELHNEGDAEHTFTSPTLNIDEELEPGARKTIEVKIGAESRYEFYCRYHKDRGMRGAFQPH
jgi:uncharacterized cupredoxin-like copper-binding protein